MAQNASIDIEDASIDIYTSFEVELFTFQASAFAGLRRKAYRAHQETELDSLSLYARQGLVDNLTLPYLDLQVSYYVVISDVDANPRGKNNDQNTIALGVARTPYLSIFSATLYQVSYKGGCGIAQNLRLETEHHAKVAVVMSML